MIGVSTGGPTALAAILPQLPAEFPLPILTCAAHAAAVHAISCGTTLHLCRLSVKEASQGDRWLPAGY